MAQLIFLHKVTNKMSAPTIGSTNVRGYVLPAGSGYDVEALQSLYGFQPAGQYNPLLFVVVGGVKLPAFTEILFDIAAAPWTPTSVKGAPTAVAVNVRRA